MRLRILYGGTIFLSSLLLFLIQPIMAKAILPWFGGSAGVWTSAMLFFQIVLLLGYALGALDDPAPGAAGADRAPHCDARGEPAAAPGGAGGGLEAGG